jgi:hypothetical protein
MTPTPSPFDSSARNRVSAVVYRGAPENAAAAASFERQGCLAAAVRGARRDFEEDLC